MIEELLCDLTRSGDVYFSTRPVNAFAHETHNLIIKMANEPSVTIDKCFVFCDINREPRPLTGHEMSKTISINVWSTLLPLDVYRVYIT